MKKLLLLPIVLFMINGCTHDQAVLAGATIGILKSFTEPKVTTAEQKEKLEQKTKQDNIKKAKIKHVVKCSKIVTFSELTHMNPYTLKGTCTFQSYLITSATGKNTAKGYLSVRRPVSYTDLSQWHTTIDRNFPVSIKTNTQLSQYFSKDFKASGLFRVQRVQGKRMDLEWLEKI